MDYFIKVVDDTILMVARQGSLPKSSDSLDMTIVGMNLNGKSIGMLALYGWFPCSMDGVGSMPDKSTITWDSESKTGSGELIPIPASNIITKTVFLDRFDDAELAAMYADQLTPGHVNAVALIILDRKLLNAPHVVKNKPENIAMIAGLVSMGYLAAGRDQVILA